MAHPASLFRAASVVHARLMDRASARAGVPARGGACGLRGDGAFFTSPSPPRLRDVSGNGDVAAGRPFFLVITGGVLRPDPPVAAASPMYISREGTGGIDGEARPNTEFVF